jgi:hypothetical protein
MGTGNEGGHFLRNHALAVALLLAIVPGCERSHDASTGNTEPKSVLDEGEVERLLALGYVDSSDPNAARDASGVVRLDAQKASPGYTLYTIEWLCKSVLIDLEGNVANVWAQEPCLAHWHNAELLPDGQLLVVDGHAGHLLRYAWEGNLNWIKPGLGGPSRRRIRAFRRPLLSPVRADSGSLR